MKMSMILRTYLGLQRRRANIFLRRPRLGVYTWITENPYSAMLYAQFRGSSAPLAMTDLRELETFTNLPVGRRLLWIHSEASYSWGRTTDEQLNASHSSFVDSLDRWSAKGGRLVWTVHDDGLHLNDPDPSRIRDIRSKLCQIADCVHVHSEAAKALVMRDWEVEGERVIVVRHPSYAPLYPASASGIAAIDSATRRRLLCFGHIKPYKDYQGLSAALDTLGPGSFEALTIAGKLAGGVTLPEQTYRRNLDLELRLGFIPDELVPTIFASTHFLVLPYTESLTSGAAALAMGFGVPVIAPALGGMREAVPKECLPLLYDPVDADGLTGALRIARDMSPETYRNITNSCRAFGAEIHPERISGKLRRFLSESGIFV